MTRRVTIIDHPRVPTEVRVKNLSADYPQPQRTEKPGAVTQLQPVLHSPGAASGVQPFPGFKTIGQAAFGALKTINAARKKANENE
jgi:hypothetical protein